MHLPATSFIKSIFQHIKTNTSIADEAESSRSERLISQHEEATTIFINDAEPSQSVQNYGSICPTKNTHISSTESLKEKLTAIQTLNCKVIDANKYMVFVITLTALISPLAIQDHAERRDSLYAYLIYSLGLINIGLLLTSIKLSSLEKNISNEIQQLNHFQNTRVPETQSLLEHV